MADPGWGEEGVTTIRAGLALGAAAGVLAAIAPRWDLVEGLSRDVPGVTKVIQPGGAVGGFGVLVAVVLGAAVFVPRMWAWLAGLGLATALAGACGLVVITARTSGDFAPHADVHLLGGGRLLTMAFWVAMVALAVILVGFRKMALAPRPAEEGAVAADEDEEDAPAPTPSGRARRKPGSGKASLAFAFGIGGFIIVIGSSLAVALGALALGDIRASGGVLPGRGLAIAAVVLGLVALSLLAALVGVGTLAATPSS
jgi:hypothetical protein